MLESIVRDKMIDHLERWKLIAETQHGFRKGGSCLSNILTFLDQVARYVDDREAVNVVYQDFAKAFDKVPHKRLIIKLEAHGITKKVVRWIEKWLSGRYEWCTTGFCAGTCLVPDFHQ